MTPQRLEELRGAIPEPENPFGKIECIRMVQNNGEVQLWNESCYLPTVLAGQYVRFEFDLSNENDENYGRVIWQRRRGEDIVVAEFSHSFLLGKKNVPLIMGLAPREFAHDEVPANQNRDEEEYAYQRAKRYKQPYKVSAVPDGDAG